MPFDPADPYSDAYTGAGVGVEQPTDQEPPPPGWEWDPQQGTYVPAPSVIGAPVAPTAPAGPATSDVAGGAPPLSGTPAPTGGLPTDLNVGGDGTLTEHFKPPPTPFPGVTGNGVPALPQFNAPGYTKPPAFNYKDWLPTTPGDVTSDPGFQFGLTEGEQALQQSAASKGVLNTGGTLKDILKYGQDYATTRFNDVDTRRRNDYTMGRSAALQDYNTNYGTQYTDPYAIAYRSAQDAFAPQMTGYTTNAQANQRGNELAYSNAYDAWHNWQNDTWNKLFQLSTS